MKKDKNVKDQVQDELVENKETTTETEEIVQQEEYIFERFLDVDIKTGLSEDVVSARAEHGYNNVVEATSGKTIGKIFRDNLLTFFNLLYLVITTLLIIAESWSNLTYLPVVIANTVIGIVQEIKAKLMIDKLSLVSAPKADRKSTRLNSSHVRISYAVFCL